MLRLRALMLALALPATAAGPKPKSAVADNSSADHRANKEKRRTLQELIAFTLKAGSDGPLPDAIAKVLGFAPGTPSKEVTYAAEASRDGQDHSLFVVLDEARAKPLALVGFNLSSQAENPPYFIFRASLSGSLESATQGAGVPQNGAFVNTPIDESVKARFQREIRFFLGPAAGLKPSK